MSQRPSYIYLIPHLLRTLLSKPITVSFPNGPLQLPAAYRGQVVVDIDSCKGCGLCARDCPSGALFVERQGEKGVRIVHFYDRCTSCGQCELSCRYHAVHLQSSFRAGASSHSTLKVEWVKSDSDA